MRSLALVLTASLVFITSVHGQALTEHAAASAGAAIGAGAGKGLSNSMTKIFGETDKEAAKAAKPEHKKQPKTLTNLAQDPKPAKSKPSAISAVEDAPVSVQSPAPHASTQPRSRAPHKPAPQDETAAALSPARTLTPIATAPPVAEPKVPTVEDLAKIKIGTTEEELVTALGQPSSRVTIPDDDGHLRQTCQYWANGRVLGIIRLDNGQVVTVETQPEN